jgi:hypothetical protein
MNNPRIKVKVRLYRLSENTFLSTNLFLFSHFNQKKKE